MDEIKLTDGLLLGFCPQCNASYPKKSVRPGAGEHICKEEDQKGTSSS